jgi:ABC-type histidine transport system ATPase subunit
VLCIDELSLGLAPALIGELLEIVREIHRRGTTVVVVEQSFNIALSIATTAVFMEKGEVRFSGPAAQLRNRPDLLRSVFLRTATGDAPKVQRPAGSKGTTGDAPKVQRPAGSKGARVVR